MNKPSTATEQSIAPVVKGAGRITPTQHEKDEWSRRLDDKKGAFSAADARLIAAAPEMLALLERIERSACCEQVTDSRCICFRCKAAEILAKINPAQL